MLRAGCDGAADSAELLQYDGYGKAFTAKLDLKCDHTYATVLGDGVVNGVAVSFRIDVEDHGEPGKNDTFAITRFGCEDGGTLNDGNIRSTERVWCEIGPSVRTRQPDSRRERREALLRSRNWDDP